MNAMRIVGSLVVLLLMSAGGYFVSMIDGGDTTPETAEGILYVYVSPSCNACRMSKPVVDKLKKEGFHIKVVDVTHSPKKAGKAGVAFVPTFIHYANGKETKRIKGTASEREIRSMFRP